MELTNEEKRLIQAYRTFDNKQKDIMLEFFETISARMERERQIIPFDKDDRERGQINGKER